MAQDVLRIDGDGGRVGTQVDEHAARTALGLGQYGVGQSQRCVEHLGNMDASHLEAAVPVLVEGLTLQDVQVVALQTGALYADRVLLILRVDLVFLYGGVDNLLVRIVGVAVGIDQFVNHGVGHDSTCRQILRNHIAHATNRLSANANVHLLDLCLQLSFQFPDDALQALGCLVDVVNHSLADER